MATFVMVMTEEDVSNLKELAQLENKKKIVCFENIGKPTEWTISEMQSLVNIIAGHLVYRFMQRKDANKWK